MPTLLIVQVGLGRVIREGNVTTATISEREIRFTSVVLDTFFTTTHGDARQSRTYPVDEEALDVHQSSTDKAVAKNLPALPLNT